MIRRGNHRSDGRPRRDGGKRGHYRGDTADVDVDGNLAAFDRPGMAFWTAMNLASAQGDTWVTIGSDIGEGAVSLGLTSGSGLLG